MERIANTLLPARMFVIYTTVCFGNELKKRNISKYNISSGLKEIEDEAYIKTFNLLAAKRWAALTEKNLQKKKKKFADYLLYRGWESELVYGKINEFIKLP